MKLSNVYEQEHTVQCDVVSNRFIKAKTLNVLNPSFTRNNNLKKTYGALKNSDS